MGTRSRRYWRWVSSTAASAAAWASAELAAEAGDLGFELEDALARRRG